MSAKLLKRAALIAALMLAGSWAQARGQESQLQQEYDAALLRYQAAVQALSAQTERFEDIIVSANQAALAGDQGARDAALTRQISESRELLNRQRRVQDLKEALGEARSALLEALDVRRERLETELAEAPTPEAARQVNALLLDLDYEYEELQTGPSAFQEEGLVFYASLRLDPRDGPLEWDFKANLLDRKAADAETRLEEVDQQITRLEARQRVRRSGEAFTAGVDRFDNTRLPTGVNRARPPERGGVAADSISSLEQLPLDQQIEFLETLRLQLVESIEQARRQARVFHDLLGGNG